MIKKHRTQKGFTLIEVLVALTVFMIFMISIISSYLDMSRAQREAMAVREVYSEIRYVFNLIAEEARLGTIDYSCYSTASSLDNFEGEQRFFYNENSEKCVQLRSTQALTSSYSNYLALISRDKTKRTIFRVFENPQTEEKELQIWKEENTSTTEGNAWRPMTGYSQNYQKVELNNIKLNSFIFEISPLVDPYNVQNIAWGPVQFQPSVSVYTSLESISQTNNAPDISLDLQTSISSRAYDVQTDIPYLTN